LTHPADLLSDHWHELDRSLNPRFLNLTPLVTHIGIMVGNVTAEDLSRVVERLTDGLMLFDREGRLLYLNAEAARILGRPAFELIGKPLRETMPEVVSKMAAGARDRLEVVAQRNLPDWWLDYCAGDMKERSACGTALGAGERVVVEDVTQSPMFVGTEALDIQLKAGIRALQWTPLTSRTGAPIGMIATHWKAPHRIPEQTLRLLDLLARRAADLIERVQMEGALRDAVQARDQVLGVVAHDLRNPLNLILMQSTLMRRSAPEPENQKAGEVISRAAARMNRLIQDLLEVTRIEAGRMSIDRRPLSPGALATEAMEMHVALAASSSIEVRRSGGRAAGPLERSGPPPPGVREPDWERGDVHEFWWTDHRRLPTRETTKSASG
jgi:signal transduction histidine kinase